MGSIHIPSGVFIGFDFPPQVRTTQNWVMQHKRAGSPSNSKGAEGEVNALLGILVCESTVPDV